MQRLKEMKATWTQNKPKLKACRAEVKKQGLMGVDRWSHPGLHEQILSAWGRRPVSQKGA